MTEYVLDDAAMAALYHLAAAPKEHIGLLYDTPNGVAATPTQSRNRQGEVKGKFSVPANSLQALFHNHPSQGEMKSSPTPSKFSKDDIQQAHKFGVPSYITTPNGGVWKYDPATGKVEEVLGMFPIGEMLQAVGGYKGHP